MIEVHGFYSALKKEILDDLSFSAGIMKLDPAQLKSLVAFLNTHDGYHLDELQDLIYKAYDDFVKNIPAPYSGACNTVLQRGCF